MKNAIFILLVACHLGVNAQSELKTETAEQVVRSLYDLVSWEPNNTPNWDTVKEVFIDEAVVVLRTGKNTSGIVDKQGFVDLFVKDIEKHGLDKTGFQEKIVSLEINEFNNIAHATVIFEVSIPGTEYPPQKGLDSFHLIKKGKRWWIASILNDYPNKGQEIPEKL